MKLIHVSITIQREKDYNYTVLRLKLKGQRHLTQKKKLI